MKKIKLNLESGKIFKEGFAEYLDNCRARNLREGTLKHYDSSYKTIIKIINTFNLKTFENI